MRTSVDLWGSSGPALARWPRRLAAVALLGGCAWVAVSEGGGIRHGHPAYLLVLVGAALGGLVVLLRRPVRSRGHRVRSLVLGLVWILLLATLVAARPASAQERAVVALRPGTDVVVRDGPTVLVLEPAPGVPRGVGVAFVPGGFVDPWAYAVPLTRVAAAGHPVVVVKAPLGVGLLARSIVAEARREVPGTSRWVVGGHSLGGVAAAAEAAALREAGDARLAGLLLWASYPQRSLAQLSLPVLSVYGTRDGASTPQRVLAAAAELPADARFVAVDGAVHAHFGDYGPQRGADGIPTVTREQAQREIVAATLAWLAGRS